MLVMLNFWLKKVGIKHEISDKRVGIFRTSIFFPYDAFIHVFVLPAATYA
jgi:hypothetical protein